MSDVEIKRQIEEYKAIKAQIKALEKQLEPVRGALEKEAIEHGGEMVVDCHTVKVIETSRENFDLKEAKKILGEALTPFVSRTYSTQVRVS